jgi:hypothetical protein
MGYEREVRRRRSAVRRAWMHCLLLSLPGLVFAILLLYWQQVSFAPALLLVGCLLLYLVLVAGALIEGIVRPW